MKDVTANRFKDVDVMVCDFIMGGGKTSAAINKIKQSPYDEKILFVTPYLEQVKRVIEECPLKKFTEPLISKGHGKKIQHLKSLIRDGNNIVTTHALFQLFDDEVIEMIREQGYTLYLDEVTQVIELYTGLTNETDYNIFISEFAAVDDDGIISWRNDVDYNGDKFADEKRFCHYHSLARYSDSTGKRICLWLFPMDIFTAFKKIYILTYMFEGQLQACYYKYFGLPYRYIYVTGETKDTFAFTDDERKKRIMNIDYSSLIHICENDKLNRIGGTNVNGSDKYKLSHNWYKNNKYNGGVKKLKNNLFNWFNNISIRQAENWHKRLWTTFKDFRNKCKGNGYSNAFLSVNARATNQFSQCTSVAYPVNIFVNSFYSNFFKEHNIEFDEDSYALSEMLQFIWRSAIRDGNPIEVYVPSIRMRTLLKRWIAENSVISSKSA